MRRDRQEQVDATSAKHHSNKKAGAASAARLEMVRGAGDAARRISEHNWHGSSVGPISTWPASLRSAIQMCVSCEFPMHVSWGPELTLFYNDAYAEFLGPKKHPDALGRPTREVWPEVWHRVGPLIDSIMATEKGIKMYAVPGAANRQSPDEEIFVTFCTSPLYDDDGHVGGVFGIGTEVTQAVVGKRRDDALAALRESTTRGKTVKDVCDAFATTLSEHVHDVPFAALYLLGDKESCHRVPLAAVAGLDFPFPPNVNLSDDEHSVISRAYIRAQPTVVAASNLRASGQFSDIEAGSARAILISLSLVSPDLEGLLAVGVNMRVSLDQGYHDFGLAVASILGAQIARTRRAENQLQRENFRARLERTKESFLDNIAHEFKTPIMLILAPVEDALRDDMGSLPRGHRKNLQIVHRNILRLSHLVNDMLHFAQEGSIFNLPRFLPVELDKLTQELAEQFSPLMAEADLQFEVNCQNPCDNVFVDKGMWETIVLNLLSNAYKYTTSGKISVDLKPDGVDVCLRISDTGVGIPQDATSEVFNRFYRVKNSSGRSSEGSGLGLALVKEFVELHGGTIQVESVLGKGSSFVVRFPTGTEHLNSECVDLTGETEIDDISRRGLAIMNIARGWGLRPPSGGDALIPEHVPIQKDLSKPRILVVDDNPDMREFLTRLLNHSFAVETANDGQAGIEMARMKSFDLMLLDVMMPKSDGLDMLRQLRRDPKLKSLPVILISARCDESAIVDGLASDADDYLVKPFSSSELMARIQASLRLVSLRQALSENRVKDEFLATLGHELRNPLAAIAASTALLRLEHEKSSAVPRVERQLKRLTRIIDDLLDVSRIRMQKLVMHKQNFRLVDAINATLENVEQSFAQRNQRLVIELPPASISVVGDFDRIVQALTNLMSNAAKFSDDHARIEVKTGLQNDTAFFSVRDPGVGINAELLPHVFEVFTQASQSLDRSKGGLGIGLAVARRILEMHGGSIDAYSDGLGRGSEFVARLPLRNRAPMAHANSEINASDASAVARTGKRVLIIEDNDDACEAMAMIVSTLGYDVRTAKDGLAGLNSLESFQPHVCLCDIGLPKLDGYAIARAVRKDPQAHRSLRHLIAVTGYGTEMDRRRALAEGFDRHLVKPIDLQKIRACLDEEKR